MKKSILFATSAIALVGCGGSNANPDWSLDCVRNHSTTGREYSRCLQKLNDMKAAQPPAKQRGSSQESGPTAIGPTDIPLGQVTVDPEGTDIESVRESQSRTRRGALESPDTEK